MRKLLIAILSMSFFLTQSLRAEEVKPYAYGDIKYFNYGITTSDLQDLNREMIALGFSSSYSSTDNRGWGFELGFGADVTKNLAVEVGYVNFGTLTITNTTTGPATTNTLDIDGNSIGGALVAKFGENEKEYFYGKLGMHAWDLAGKVNSSLGVSGEVLGDGTDLFFGVGYRSQVFKIGYDYYKLDDQNITAVNVGLVYNF